MQFLYSIENCPTPDWLTNLIGQFINLFPTVAIGVIFFTVALKLITLVFDYYSRASMRKSSLKMKEMRPELERLQEQFKNNKELYNQKVMALYKKEGYSVFGSCLPTILTLVIFIIVLNSFNAYSVNQNQKYLYDMATSYNQVLIDGIETDDDYIKTVPISEGSTVDKLAVDVKKVLTDAGENNFVTLTGKETKLYFTKEKTSDTEEKYNYVFFTDSGYVKLNYVVEFATAGDISTLTFVENPTYSANEIGLKASSLTVDGTAFAGTTVEEAEAFIKEAQYQAVADTYFNERQSFLWVKNIWKQDAVYGLKSCNQVERVTPMVSLTDGKDNVITQDVYNIIITSNGRLTEASNEVNGYYILVALTILSTLLTQIVMTRSQKDQMELQTVDGQGAQTQKMMLWMMPLMMAVFAFIYTAAFSLYIIVNTLLSTLTTVIINKIVDKKFEKEKAKEAEKTIIRRG